MKQPTADLMQMVAAEADSVAIMADGDVCNIGNVHCLVLNQRGADKIEQPGATAGDGRVALELLDRITKHDRRFQAEGSDRKYWLELFSQCLRSTVGLPLAAVLEE